MPKVGNHKCADYQLRAFKNYYEKNRESKKLQFKNYSYRENAIMSIKRLFGEYHLI